MSGLMDNRACRRSQTLQSNAIGSTLVKMIGGRRLFTRLLGSLHALRCFD